MPAAALADDIGDTSKCSAVIVAVFLSGGSLGGDLPAFVEQLTAGPTPAIMLAVGSPYVLATFPRAAAALASFSATVPSEVSAVKAMFGEIAITGHLPVTLPGFAQYGDGIQLPATKH